MTWLNDYPEEKKDYKRALQCYLKEQDEKVLGDVIKNCYLAVEGIARKVLENTKTLVNNGDIRFTYREARTKYGLSRPRFRRAID